LHRLEIPNSLDSFKTSVVEISKLNNSSITTPINIIFSQINSVNNQIPDLKKLNILRLFLTKSYRGRCHALGKPVKGQRTWSNAWNSFNLNRTARSFVSETKRILKKDVRQEKINYKLTQKKYAKKATKRKDISIKKQKEY
jgi:ribosomal protein S13